MEYRPLDPGDTGCWHWRPEPIDLVVLGDQVELARWERAMLAELSRPVFAGVHVELHGDFPTDGYLTAWLDIARALPGTTFHTVTDEHDRMARLAEPDAPDNFRWDSTDGDVSAADRGPSTERQAADRGDS